MSMATIGQLFMKDRKLKAYWDYISYIPEARTEEEKFRYIKRAGELRDFCIETYGIDPAANRAEILRKHYEQETMLDQVEKDADEWNHREIV